jgi:DNA polymerase II large subunit
MKIEEYFREIEGKVKHEYSIAGSARAKGLDPLDKVEVLLATNLAEKSLGLVSTIYPQLNDKRIVTRILELEKEYGALDMAVAFKIAEEISKERFCKFESLLQSIDAGIRVGFAYMTLGVVSSPLEGYTELKFGKTQDGKEYFKAYFSGPIRSAGTTASCIVLILIDYLRELFGFAKFDPTEAEIKRYIVENYDYHERVTNLQYLPTEEEIEFLARNLPIQVSGEPTEKREVSNYKDLGRIETNFIRGGMCLIFSEGLAQKAQKGLRQLRSLQSKGFQIIDWEFLDEYIKIHKKREKGTLDTSPTYIKDLVAGRPVFSHPSRSGGFRFRYGRSRVSGFSATSIHPATMATSNCFLSSGTQLKVEKPTKGCAITSCDSIDGPIVKLSDGSVKKLDNFEEAKKLYKNVDEIIYLGDILFSLGDVMNRNYELIKPGYVEEWWELELKKAIENANAVEDVINSRDISLEKAIYFSEKYNVPLHPKYIYFWSQIDYIKFLDLLDWIKLGNVSEEKIILPYNKSDREKFEINKRALEIIGIEHEVSTEHVVLNKENSKAFLLNIGISSLDFEEKFENYLKKVYGLREEFSSDQEIKVLDLINSLSKFKIKDKAGTFIGARMGRPEKAKPRELKGSPHVLFPIGEEGGRLRSFQAALEKGSVKADFPLYFCETCGKETIYFICESCGSKTKQMNYCPVCGKKSFAEGCSLHGRMKPFMERRINIIDYYKIAMKKANVPDNFKIIKGVRGTSSETHVPENIVKGILRATFNLHVNKDGTIRYDVTELPITHFKPKEIGTSIEKLKELGYEKDINGKVLENEEQILELKPQDIILPSCPDSSDEKADHLFINLTKFIDSLLVNFYGLEEFYKVKTKEDLIGKMVVCMAPHNCAGVITRILGFSKVQGILASPYLHAAVRRDCDGDEVAVMLLLDVLLNFSRKFLPAHRGGTQDAPLVLNARIRPGEVDDQILDFELSDYPLELYEMAERQEHSSKIVVDNVRSRLKEGKDPLINIGFTHNTDNFNEGVVNSAYKSIPTMQEKVEKQMELVKKIRAVDEADIARLIIERHFIRDIKGNFNKFTQQQFRCVDCNEIYRRPPLIGKCIRIKSDGTVCNGRIIFTIAEGSIIKYLEAAIGLAKNYAVSNYVRQSIELVKLSIEAMFGKETEKQQALKQWF